VLVPDLTPGAAARAAAAGPAYVVLAGISFSHFLNDTMQSLILKFPNLDWETGILREPKRGNANELGDVSESPGKSFLFFLRDGHPGMGSTRDRVVVPAKRHGSCGVRCALADP